MNLKVKAMVLLVAFGAILYLPFVVQAGSGNAFEGLPVPDFSDSVTASSGGAADSGDDAVASAYADEHGLTAAGEQYAASLPKPAIAGESVQKSISIDDMRNHMNILKEEGRSTDQCLACHTDRTQFCDRCHSYAGVSPKI